MLISHYVRICVTEIKLFSIHQINNVLSQLYSRLKLCFRSCNWPFHSNRSANVVIPSCVTYISIYFIPIKSSKYIRVSNAGICLVLLLTSSRQNGQVQTVGPQTHMFFKHIQWNTHFIENRTNHVGMRNVKQLWQLDGTNNGC